ncbi:MAG: hypothetical protein JNM33_01665 [Rubrivivax sp.]|nr:hypothetical protein [Rubrivivax sp.]
MPAGLHLQLSVTPCVLRAGVPAVALASRDAALLAWLVLEGPTPRAQLASLLWPESPPEAARSSLRQRLFQLRKQLGADIVGGQHTLRLAPGVSHDLDHTHELLADVAPDLPHDFSDWLLRRREQRHAAHLQTLEAEAERCEQAGQIELALPLAQALLGQAPLSEAAHRRVMRLHYLSGDRTAALLAFDACERVLKNEVGTRPSAETLNLLQAIEAVQGQGLGPPKSLPVSLRRPPQLLGRDLLLVQLQQAWQNQQHFALLGEPGQGKTRVLEQLASEWPGAQLVRARPGDEAVPLALLARLVEQVDRAHPALRDTPSGQALRQVLPLPLSGSQVPQRQPARSLAPPLQDWLTEAGALGVALLLDDWQFADDASVALLGRWLADAGACPLRIGLASRLHAGPQAAQRLQTLQQMGGVQTVTLPPLDEEAIDRLLGPLLADLARQGHAAGAADSATLARALLRRVGGNPLHVLESLRHMVHNQLPLQPEQLAVPRQVRDLVAERLGQLPADARQLLQVAAVAGQDFSVELAEAVTGRHALTLAEAWAQLEQRGMFGPQGTSHDLFAEVALSQLPTAIAKVLHERVAGWLAPRPHEPGRMAAHWRAAGRDEAAVPHLLNAAVLAWRAARADETFDFHAQAARITLAQGQPDQAFEQWFDNAEAMSEIGTAAQAAHCLRELEPLVRTEGQALRVRFVRAVLRAAQGDVDSGLSDVGNMLADAIALGDMRLEAECRFACASRASADGDFDSALQHLAVGERLQREMGNERLAAALAATKAMVLGLRGQPRLAQREAERVLPLLAAHQDRATWIVLCSAQALLWLRQGLVDQALTEARRARQAAASASIAPMDLLVILRNLVDTLRWAGQFEEALAVGQEFELRLATQGQFQSVHRTLAALYLSLGRADLARQLIGRREPAIASRLRHRERLQLDLLHVQIALTTGQPDPVHWPHEAVTCGDAALACEWALWSGLDESCPWSVTELAELELRARQGGMLLMAEPLQALLACRGMGSLPMPEPGPEPATATGPWTAWFMARHHLQQGQTQAARSSAARGLQGLQRMADPWVPAAFKASFLQRHPVHRALQLLATRLGSDTLLPSSPEPGTR